MPPRARPRRLGGGKPLRPSTEEWLGCAVEMPGRVLDDDGSPYQAAGLLWVDAEGLVVGNTLTRADDVLDEACASLRAAIVHPLAGPPRAPARVRVAAPALAAALQAGLDDIEVVCAPTPELDELVAAMLEHLAVEVEELPTYLERGIEPAAVADLFAAAADLHNAAPWEVTPADAAFLVSSAALGLDKAVVNIIGHMGESFGLLLFDSRDDFEDYGETGEAMRLGLDPDVPPHRALSFERGAELGPRLRHEIATHGWTVVAADTYPDLLLLDEHGKLRPPRAEDVTLFAALARAVTVLVDRHEELDRAWWSGAAFEHRGVVPTRAGDITVTFTLTERHETAAAPPPPPRGLLASFAALERPGDALDPDAHEALVGRLEEEFRAAPESRGLRRLEFALAVPRLAAQCEGATLASLDRELLREVLLHHLPYELDVEPADAPAIIEATRALLAFLARAHGFRAAGDCQRALTHNTELLLAHYIEQPEDIPADDQVPDEALQDMLDAIVRAATEAEPRRARSRAGGGRKTKKKAAKKKTAKTKKKTKKNKRAR